jgi:DNA-binding GntR family transcriptional regulator
MILKTLIEKINHAIDAQDHDQIGQVNIEFHRKIYTASKNSTLVSLIDDLCEKTFFARLVFKFNPERAKVSNEEHVMIVEALEKQDLENAEKLIIQQSEKTLNLLKDL